MMERIAEASPRSLARMAGVSQLLGSGSHPLSSVLYSISLGDFSSTIC